MVKEFDLSEKRFSHLESVIKKYRQDFYPTGKALKEIHDGRYYQRLSFKSFESYVGLRWDMSRSQAYRLIEAVAVIDNLSPIGDVLPKNEAQARPLTKLDPHSQRRIWREFLDTSKPLSAFHITRFVSAKLGEQNPKKPFSEIISKEYREAIKVMLSQIAIARNDRWQSTSKRTALYWNHVMEEKIRWGR